MIVEYDNKQQSTFFAARGHVAAHLVNKHLFSQLPQFIGFHHR